MTTQLPERLRELADEAPGPLAASGLWREGHRRRRRRVMRSVAALAAVLVLAGLGLGDARSREAEPVVPPTGHGPMSVPDLIVSPSPWTPSTRAPGRLVAVLGATRDHFPFGSDRGTIAGVAAGSQAYRFLDLPDQATDEEVALSPDGRHLAYWLSARVGDPPPVGSVAGVAVLDLTTGAVERHVLLSQFGFAPGTLTWTGPDRVAMVTDRFTSREPTSYAGRTRTYLLTVGDPSSAVILARRDVLAVPVTARDGYAEVDAPRTLRAIRGTGVSTADARLSRPVKSLAYDAPGRLVAATAGNVDADGSTSGPLVVGRVVAGRVLLTPVPGGGRYYRAVAWVDRHHVAAVRLTTTGVEYDVVDVHTGERRVLTRRSSYSFDLALDAVRHATSVPAVAPPQPWNPRVLVLGGLGCAAGAGALVLVARRRRGRS